MVTFSIPKNLSKQLSSFFKFYRNNIQYHIQNDCLIFNIPLSCLTSLSLRLEEDSIAVSLTEGFDCPEKTVYSP